MTIWHLQLKQLFGFIMFSPVICCEAGTKDKDHFTIKLQCCGHVFVVGQLMTS